MRLLYVVSQLNFVADRHPIVHGGFSISILRHNSKHQLAARNLERGVETVVRNSCQW